MQKNKDFLRDYKLARSEWLAGRPALFPNGTYWLRKFANVSVSSVDPPSTPATN